MSLIDKVLARTEGTYHVVKSTFVSVDERSGVLSNGFVLTEQPFALGDGGSLLTVGDVSIISLSYTEEVL